MINKNQVYKKNGVQFDFSDSAKISKGVAGVNHIYDFVAWINTSTELSINRDAFICKVLDTMPLSYFEDMLNAAKIMQEAPKPTEL